MSPPTSAEQIANSTDALLEINMALAGKIDGAAHHFEVRQAQAQTDCGLAAVYTENSSGRLVISALVLVGKAITADTLRRIPMIALENSANLTKQDVNREALQQLPPLRREPGQTPEAFSELVAQHYRLWASAVPYPGAAMAAENGVKPATMHSWIREARLRGLLPPATRGKR